MAAVLPESKREVLEDKDEAILPEPKLEDGEEFSSLDEAGKAEEETKPEPKGAKKDAPEKEDDEIPAELKGKSQKELARMYRDSQQLIGRQGAELGEFRRKADQLIHASLENLRKGQRQDEKKEPEKKEEELDDTQFFAGPKDAVSRMIENHPVIKEIRKTLGASAADREQERATRATEKFNQTHPDSAEIMQDPEFRSWVNASKVRTALLHRAHAKFDFDAGDEVFGTWKALKGAGKKEDVKNEDPTKGELDASTAARALAKRKQELKDAKTPSGGGGGQKESGSKKIYRRADVLKLMEEDADRYEALAPEIEKAYRDGRVR